MRPKEFVDHLASFQVTLTPTQEKQFRTYFHLLVEWNQKMNLTTIVEEDQVYLKHFYDSVAPILYQQIKNEPIHLLDIGAGAGFPSLPMKILYPQLKITIIDSLNKRIGFLSHLVKNLDLDQVTLLHGRAEDLGQNSTYRENFDLVTARAVAKLNLLSELTLPFLMPKGRLVALKATSLAEEIDQAQPAFSLLGGQLLEPIDYQLPNGDERHLVIVEKIGRTPKKYPRKPGIPAKSPL